MSPQENPQPGLTGPGAAAAPTDDASLKTWRLQMRRELIGRRLAVPAPVHARWCEAIAGHLETLLSPAAQRTFGFCWPYKREFDARPTVLRLLSQGARAALPVVVAARSPLDFRLWHADAAMEDGAFGIPIPRDGPVVIPDVLLLPANGFDEAGFRLGYGGGFFDRTLEALEPRPLAIGICFESGRLATVHPQPYDQPLDYVVTERAVFRRGTLGLELVSGKAGSGGSVRRP